MKRLKRYCTLYGFAEKKKFIKSKEFQSKEWSLDSIEESKIFHITVIKMEEVKKYISQVTIYLKSKQTLEKNTKIIEEYLVFEKNILDSLDTWKFVGNLEKDKEYAIPTTKEVYDTQ